MTVKEIMEQIREGLTGEYNVDMVYLESQADKYRSTKDGKEIDRKVGVMPPQVFTQVLDENA